MFISNFRLKTRVQKLLFDMREVFDFPRLHPGREIQIAALLDAVEYLDSLPALPLAVPTARQLMDLALQRVTLDGPYVELGVYKGATIRYIAKCAPGGTEVHGFDSFSGLPAAWTGNASAFDTGGKLPRVPRNVSLHVGFFDDTLPDWVAEQRDPVAFVHIDCDVYESARSAFKHLAPSLAPGTIIVFDEYFNYPGWRAHEFRAFQEYVTEQAVRYTYLAYARIQMAVRIDEIGRAT